MGDILRAEIPIGALELPEPQAPEIIEQSTGATRVAPFLLVGAAVAGFLAACSSPGHQESAPPPPPPYSAPPSETWSPSPSFSAPSASPSALPTASPAPAEGKGGGATKPFQCNYALAERVGGLVNISVGGKGDVTKETHAGVMEDDGIRWWPGTKFSYKANGQPIVVVAGNFQGGVTPGAKVASTDQRNAVFDLCDTIHRY